jgi:hypothetical protein
VLGFRKVKAMARQRSHSIAFKRQVAQEFVAGETLYGLAKRNSRQYLWSDFSAARRQVHSRQWLRHFRTG